MPGVSLSRNDGSVLQQIFDPEAAPNPHLLIDPTQASDPHYEQSVFATIVEVEKAVIATTEAAMQCSSASHRQQVLQQAAQQLETLLQRYPRSGSLHNDLAQVLRLQYGAEPVAESLLRPSPVTGAALRALEALNAAVKLLSPPSPLTALSPTQCRTLAQAHMQRGAMRYGAAKHMMANDGVIDSDEAPAFRGWSRSDLEEAASRDFFMGGRYGNEIGKALAVHTNPTAKLCGQMVQDAMRREFALGTPKCDKTVAE